MASYYQVKSKLLKESQGGGYTPLQLYHLLRDGFASRKSGRLRNASRFSMVDNTGGINKSQVQRVINKPDDSQGSVEVLSSEAR